MRIIDKLRSANFLAMAIAPVVGGFRWFGVDSAALLQHAVASQKRQVGVLKEQLGAFRVAPEQTGKIEVDGASVAPAGKADPGFEKERE